jgi:serine/threonine-protein kinase
LHEDRTTVNAAKPSPAPVPAPAPAPRQHTRELTADPTVREYQPAPDQFAGIELDEFEWARQRGKRMTVIWLLVVLILTGLVAAAAWTVGSNLDGLF